MTVAVVQLRLEQGLPTRGSINAILCRRACSIQGLLAFLQFRLLGGFPSPFLLELFVCGCFGYHIKEKLEVLDSRDRGGFGQNGC